MNLFSDKIKTLIPYVPGEQPKDGVYIKLNTNENPYPPSPKVIEAIKEATDSRLRLYPDPECTELRQVYADYLELGPNNVFVGNGSDEVLSIAFQAFFMGKENVLMPDITYSFYPVYCSLYDVKAVELPLNNDFTIDAAMYRRPNNGILIANPNAPTSIALDRNSIEEIIKMNPESVVLVDEAYVDFGGESVSSLIKKYSNLLVVSTLSKSRSLAGLRVGLAAGDIALIEAMNTVKNSINSYPIDLLAQTGAIAAILDTEYFEETRQRIIETREWTRGKLIKLGFDVPVSKANFLFIESNVACAEDIFQKLKKEKILVRFFKKPKIDNRLRVSIGTREEMEKFVEAINKLMI